MLAVGRGGHVARHAARERVQQDERREERPAVVGVEGPHEGEAEDAEREEQELGSRAQEGGKERAAGREAKRVAGHVLPPALVLVATACSSHSPAPREPEGLLVVPPATVSTTNTDAADAPAGKAREVRPQHPHEDGGHKARQQQDRHAAVDDAEPVDLQVYGVQREALVAREAVGVPRVRALPLGGVGEGDLERLALGRGALGDVDGAGRVGQNVPLDDVALLLVVLDVKVEVREEEDPVIGVFGLWVWVVWG